ncbi:MAG TPA: EVE domain-containing protein [Stellaceae bacterium]|nr:EVE domain-containing protein [Stellaceae bacterium]
MTGYWIVIASAEHVRNGRAGNFMQACHGKVAPLRRIQPGDGVVCYSPTATFRGGDRLQAFTAIGTATEGAPYQVEMAQGFRPFRRNVAWVPSREAPIAPLLDKLELTAGKRNWGYAFRFGLLGISPHDFALIARAMGVEKLRPAA